MTRVITALSCGLLMIVPAFAAIEFSEDQVAATAASPAPAIAAVASTSGGNVSGGVTMVGSSQGAGPAAAAQSAIAVMASTRSGAAGSIGSSAGAGAAGMTGGGGGQAASNTTADVCFRDPLTGAHTDSNGQVTLAAPSAATTNGTPPTATGMPEPTGMVVWSVLGLAGLVVLRRRRLAS